MAARKLKFYAIIGGTRVRVYATRTEYEVVFDDDDVAGPEALVLMYPKMGDPHAWVELALVDRSRFNKG